MSAIFFIKHTMYFASYTRILDFGVIAEGQKVCVFHNSETV